MAQKRRIAVIGAGIIGVSTAAYLRDRLPQDDICIFAKELSPGTTGDSAAGLWIPGFLNETFEHLLRSWSQRTWDFLTDFTKGTDHPQMGINYQPVYQFFDTPGAETPFWADIVATFTVLETREIQKLAPWAKSGYLFTTVVSEGAKMIQYFYRRLIAKGVRFCQREIRNFEELVDEGFDLIVNCSGLGAKTLVPDPEVVPIRGQIHLVDAPWCRAAYFSSSGAYIIPNVGKVILGGTCQKDDWLREIRQEDKKMILEGCAQLVPGCAKAPIIREWVGLRPGRKSVRLDSEVRQKADGKRYTVVHNYGHGGAGFGLFWGCAEDAANLVLHSLKGSGPARL